MANASSRYSHVFFIQIAAVLLALLAPISTALAHGTPPEVARIIEIKEMRNRAKMRAAAAKLGDDSGANVEVCAIHYEFECVLRYREPCSEFAAVEPNESDWNDKVRTVPIVAGCEHDVQRIRFPLVVRMSCEMTDAEIRQFDRQTLPRRAPNPSTFFGSIEELTKDYNEKLRAANRGKDVSFKDGNGDDLPSVSATCDFVLRDVWNRPGFDWQPPS